jgi:SAM-dependent methyltransferase
MKILNLGCGSKVSSRDEVINVDWSPLLRIKRNPIVTRLAPLLLDTNRLGRFRVLGENIVVHDISKGIPFLDESIDVVYHSHMLEHLDREVASAFMQEVLRVLKPGGIQRIVVPDLERLCREYLLSVELSENDSTQRARHDGTVEAMLEQSVRREANGTARQSPIRRSLENLFLGDARQRGETHQWMYDRINLAELLIKAGFANPRRERYDTSIIDGWNAYYLDMAPDGREINPGSLYMEASKPEGL